MTTEEDFHRHLDAHPDDHQTRQVFADFLEEQGDPRAAGYRALGKLQKTPEEDMDLHWFVSTQTPSGGLGADNQGQSRRLPHDWIQQIHSPSGHLYYRQRPTRRQIEDEAALGFSKLPPERQHELLNQNNPVLHSRKLVNRRLSYKRK